jgi:hypothetical protein
MSAFGGKADMSKRTRMQTSAGTTSVLVLMRVRYRLPRSSREYDDWYETGL